MPRRRPAQQRAVRIGAPAARSAPAGARVDRRPLRRRAGDGAAQACRPGFPAGRRPGAERDLGRRAVDGALRATQQPARHRLRRSARHRAIGAAAMSGGRRGDARGSVRSRAPIPARDGVQQRASEAALRCRRERPRILHDVDRGAGPRRRARGARCRAHRPRRRVVRHARRARVPAPVPVARAAQRARRRRAARHGLARGRVAPTTRPRSTRSSRRARRSPRARAIIPSCVVASPSCCARFRRP